MAMWSENFYVLVVGLFLLPGGICVLDMGRLQCSMSPLEAEGCVMGNANLISGQICRQALKRYHCLRCLDSSVAVYMCIEHTTRRRRMIHCCPTSYTEDSDSYTDESTETQSNVFSTSTNGDSEPQSNMYTVYTGGDTDNGGYNSGESKSSFFDWSRSTSVGNRNNDGTDNDPDGSALQALAGGVVGAGVSVVLLLAIVIVLIVLLKRRKPSKPEQAETEGNSYPNAVYELGQVHVSVDYAGAGPLSHSDFGNTAEPYAYEEPVPLIAEGVYIEPASDESTLYAQLNQIETDVVTRDTVILGNSLGSGQFGIVYKGVWLSSVRGEVDVAVKTLKEGSGEEDRVKFLQEAAIMGQFKHPNVVEMYGVVQGEPVLLVLEILNKGDLRDHLLHMRSDEEGMVTVDDHTLLSYCRQVASGMTYLSNKAFVHRDLAARNILVSDDDICKIADFGMSRDLMNESYYISRGGQIPVKWTAPEALHYKKYSTASDVWSYGALMYEIWSVGHKPFENHTNNKVLKLVDAGYRLPPPPGCPRAIYVIMMSCWHPEKANRPSFPDISRQLSPPDTALLKWTEEDKTTHPDVYKLGADLFCAEELYVDLQLLYKQTCRQ